jgi:hypothetical protein
MPRIDRRSDQFSDIKIGLTWPRLIKAEYYVIECAAYMSRGDWRCNLTDSYIESQTQYAGTYARSKIGQAEANCLKLFDQKYALVCISFMLHCFIVTFRTCQSRSIL